MVSGVTVKRALDAQAECRHHWIIDRAHGPTSWGVCRRCAARREFHNSCPGIEWEERPALDSLSSSLTYSLSWERLRPLSPGLEDEPDRAGADSC